jgi:hypothetical protein
MSEDTKRAVTQCAKCGFLALRAAPYGQIAEVDLGFRISGHRSNAQRDTVASDPFCVRGVANLREEMKSADTNDDRERKNVPSTAFVIQADRTCEGFMKWHQGFTAREHLDIMREDDLAALRQEQREIDRQLLGQQREADRELLIDQREADRKFLVRQAETDSRRFKIEMSLFAVLIFATLAAVLIQVFFGPAKVIVEIVPLLAP